MAFILPLNTQTGTITLQNYGGRSMNIPLDLIDMFGYNHDNNTSLNKFLFLHMTTLLIDLLSTFPNFMAF